MSLSVGFQDWASCCVAGFLDHTVVVLQFFTHAMFAHQRQPLDGKLHEMLNEWIFSPLL